MNKKFSTLVASVLLAGAMGTVDAANYAKYAGVPSVATVIKQGNFYQICDNANGGNRVLAMTQGSNGACTLRMVATTDKQDLANTLWTIASQQNAEGGYSYVFVNYKTGLQLAVNSENAVKNTGGALAAPTGNVTVGGDVQVWKWQTAPDPKNETFNAKPIISTFSKDSALILTTDGGDKVGTEKFALNNTPSSQTYALSVKPADPAAVILGVDDLNSMLWKGKEDGKMKLTFTPDVKGNEFANVFTQELKAVQAVGYPFINWTPENPGETDAEKDYNAFCALYKLEFYKASETLMNEISALFVKDKSYAQLVYNKIFAPITWGLGNGAETATAYTTLCSNVSEIEAEGTNDEKAVINSAKAAVLKWLKATRPVFVNTNPNANDTRYQGMPVWIDAYNVAYKLSGLNSKTDVQGKTVLKEAVDSWKIPELEAAVAEKKEADLKNAAANGWVSLLSAADKYVMVDTAYMTTNAGQQYLRIVKDKAFAELKSNSNGDVFSSENWTRLDYNGRYNFQFVWHPAQDSIVIRSAGYADLRDDEDHNAKYFRDINLTADYAPAETKHTSTTNGGERNLIKIAVLGNKDHRELTVGSSEYNPLLSPTHTINTRISLNGASNYVRTTLENGIYYFNLSTELATKKADDGKNFVATFCGDGTDYETEETTQLYGVAQNFEHMPRTQWVVKQNPGITGEQTVNIYNREFPTQKYENVQLFKGGDSKVFAQFTFQANDTLSYAKVAKTDDARVGYADVKKLLGNYSNRVKLDYFSGLKIGHFVNVKNTDTENYVFVDALEGFKAFEMIPSGNLKKYGYNDQLSRQAYIIAGYEGNKLNNSKMYIGRDDDNAGYKFVADVTKAVKFYLKENNEITTKVEDKNETTCYYALVEAEPSDKSTRVGVRDASLKFSQEGICSEERIATFAVRADQTIIYRELNGDESIAIEDGIEKFVAPTAANFYRSRIVDKQYLFESAGQEQFDECNGINYLGVRTQDMSFDDSTAIYVDTADIRNQFRPQYMLAVGTEVIAKGKYCPIHGFDADCKEEHLLDVPAQVWGRYLINAQDSLENKKAFGGNNKADKRYQWEDQYTRLAFVHAMHVGDTLVIFRNGTYPLTEKGHKDYLTAMTWAREAAASTTTPGMSDKVFVMNVKDRNGNNATKAFTQDYANYKFMFRLVDDKDTRDFIIESHDGAFGLENNTYAAGENAEYRAIKVQNGVPVIARLASAEEGILNAERWNIDERCTAPTANEGIETAGVSVVATNGAVIVKGAEGKNVVITNVLGQTIANTVVSSDEATIAAPAGVVVVAVEGEAAVKAIVK